MNSGPTNRRFGLKKLLLLVAMALMVAAIPLVINEFSTVLEDADKWASVISLGVSVLALLLTTLTFREARVQTSRLRETREATAAQIVLAVAELERVAKKTLSERSGESPNYFPFSRMRDGLLQMGIWSEADVLEFDTALRVRNKVVHGDMSSVSREDLSDAMVAIRRLREKIQVIPEK